MFARQQFKPWLSLLLLFSCEHQLLCANKLYLLFGLETLGVQLSESFWQAFQAATIEDIIITISCLKIGLIGSRFSCFFIAQLLFWISTDYFNFFIFQRSKASIFRKTCFLSLRTFSNSTLNLSNSAVTLSSFFLYNKDQGLQSASALALLFRLKRCEVLQVSM